jgi:hypothetical protein
VLSIFITCSNSVSCSEYEELKRRFLEKMSAAALSCGAAAKGQRPRQAGEGRPKTKSVGSREDWEALKDTTNEVKTEMSMLQAAVQTHKHRHESIQEEKEILLTDFIAEAEDMQRRVSTLKEDLRSANDARDKSTKARKKKEVVLAQREEELNANKKQLSAKEKMLDNVRAELVDVKQLMSASEKTTSTLKDELATTKKQRDAAEKTLAKTKADLNAAKKQQTSTEKTLKKAGADLIEAKRRKNVAEKHPRERATATADSNGYLDEEELSMTRMWRDAEEELNKAREGKLELEAELRTTMDTGQAMQMVCISQLDKAEEATRKMRIEASLSLYQWDLERVQVESRGWQLLLEHLTDTSMTAELPKYLKKLDLNRRSLMNAVTECNNNLSQLPRESGFTPQLFIQRARPEFPKSAATNLISQVVPILGQIARDGGNLPPGLVSNFARQQPPVAAFPPGLVSNFAQQQPPLAVAGAAFPPVVSNEFITRQNDTAANVTPCEGRSKNPSAGPVLVDKIHHAIPDMKTEEIVEHLTNVRRYNGGKLSGLAVPIVIRLVQLSREMGPPAAAAAVAVAAAAGKQATLKYEVSECIICLEEMTEVTGVALDKCGHRFHLDCIRKWVSEKSDCPVCRNHTLLVDDYPQLS